MIDNKTPRLQLPKPDPDNYLDDDVVRLQQAFDILDSAATVGDDGKIPDEQIPTGIARRDSPNFVGIPKAPTPLEDDSSTQIANTKFLADAVSKVKNNLSGDAPDNLNTLEKLALAIANNPNFSNAISDAIGQRLAKNQNLSDLQDLKKSRDNLGVYSKSESDSSGQPGDIKYTARSTAPTGWLKANGDAVSRTTYAALFAAIGTTYGEGDGSTTFNLPDLRGEFIRGLDDGRGADPGRSIGSSQGWSPGSHVHGLAIWTSNSGSIPSRTSVPSQNGRELGPAATVGDGGIIRTLDGSGGTNNNSAVSVTTQNPTFGNPEGYPRNVALLACIKY